MAIREERYYRTRRRVSEIERKLPPLPPAPHEIVSDILEMGADVLDEIDAALEHGPLTVARNLGRKLSYKIRTGR